MSVLTDAQGWLPACLPPLLTQASWTLQHLSSAQSSSHLYTAEQGGSGAHSSN